MLTEFAAAEACANALAKALTESESELAGILVENRAYREKYAKLEQENKQLSAENKQLNAQMAAIDEELKSSHQLIDNLHKELDTHQSRQKNYDKLIRKCKAATELYKSKVNGLRAQLVGGENVVPLEAYKKAVDSSEFLSKCLKEKESEVQHLTDRIRTLEIMIKKKHFGDAPSEVEPHNEPMTNNHFKDRRVKSPSANEVSPPSDSITPRQKALRAVGGRTAFVEKMSKIRKSQSNRKGENFTRAALGAHNGNLGLGYLSTSSFVSVGGKENA